MNLEICVISQVVLEMSYEVSILTCVELQLTF